MSPVRVIIVAAVICVALLGLFYLRANTVEDIIAKLEEEGSMDNMIWFVKHFAALLPGIVMISLLSLAYGNADKYIPVITQREKLIVIFIAAIFFFGVLAPVASSSVIPEVIEEEEVIKEATTVFKLLVNWFLVQIVPFIIIAAYHSIKADSEKKTVALNEPTEASKNSDAIDTAENNG